MGARCTTVKVFFYTATSEPLTFAGAPLHSGSMAQDVMVWVRLDSSSARELDQYVAREKRLRKGRLDLRAMSRSTAIREAVFALLEVERARIKAEAAKAPDPRQAALPGTDQ